MHFLGKKFLLEEISSVANYLSHHLNAFVYTI